MIRRGRRGQRRHKPGYGQERHLLSYKRQEREVSRSLHGPGQASLVPGAGPRLPARPDAAVLRNVAAQNLILLVIDFVDFLDTKRANTPFTMVGTTNQRPRIARISICHRQLLAC